MRCYLKHAELPFSGWEIFEDVDGIQKEWFVQRYKTFEREQARYYIDVDTLDDLKRFQSLLGQYFFIVFDEDFATIKIYEGFRG